VRCVYVFDVYGAENVFVYCKTHRWVSAQVHTPSDIAAVTASHEDSVSKE
jgi:hypothetical protein